MLLVLLTEGLVAECSDGSVIFRFADAEDLTEGESIGSGEETESREPGYVEFGGKTNGAVESSSLASESEVLVQGLGIEGGDSVVEMARLASDQENEKKVVISLNSSMATVGWRVLHCLETEKLKRVGVFDGDHESKTEESELSEKRTDLEVESEIAQGMSVSIGIYGKHEQVKAKVSGSESALEVRQVCLEEEGSTLMLRGKN